MTADGTAGGALVQRVPISVRLGTAFAAVFVLVLAVLGALFWFGLGEQLRQEIDRSLVTAARALERPGSQLADLEQLDEARLGSVESPEFEAQVVSPDGALRDATDDDLDEFSVLTAEQATLARRTGSVFADVVDEDDDPQRALAVPTGPRDGEILVVLAELEPVGDAQTGLLRLFGLLAPPAVLLAGAAGWYVARRGLRPVARMAADAERISARDPFPRLAVPPSGDEVARLGTTLNHLLDRIEEVRRREREFTADASHELRTPLSILRAELELTRGTAHDEQVRQALDSSLEEADRLAHLVDDLLLLASTDAGQIRPRGPVDVAEVVDGLLAGFRTLAGRRRITVESSGEAVVQADQRALARAVANLLDNAIRHAPDGGRVTVHVARRPDGTVITVTDDGPGVPSDERARMTQRFTQLDRTEMPTGGAGLGLAIVTSVAAAHGGRLEFTDAESGRGLSASIVLPAAPGAPAEPVAGTHSR